MRRFGAILLSLSMLFSLNAWAEEQAPAAQPAAEDGPVQAIQSAIVKLNQLTAASTYSPQMVGFLVENEVAPLFDFDHIGNEVLLVVNNRLSADEAKYFSNKLKNNIISTLLQKLSQANSTSFQFISARPIMGGAVAVQLRVNGYSPYAIYLDLLFHKNEARGWQIFDVVLNNDSMTNYYQKMVLIKARRYGIYGMLGRI